MKEFSSLLHIPVKKITVGLIVEKKGIKDSNGCAPDLLLLTENQEIIPVEIKCLVGKPLKNADYRRAIHLAKLQVEGCLKIINSKGKKNKRGIIVIIYIYQDKEVFKYEVNICFI